MGKTLDLGRRIEIHSMDKHCQDISLGLYRRQVRGASRFLVHTYSGGEAAAQRVAFIRQALITMVGLEAADVQADMAGSGWLKFPCEGDHLRALRRGFLDLCRLETGAPLEPKPLTAFDKKAKCDLQIVGLGTGKYQIKAAADYEEATKRAAAVARGFAKLCEMQALDNDPAAIEFPCGIDHDALIGMLLFRAHNVRASAREEQQSAGRGMLASPSQQ